jgi:hypothetical protein
MLLWEGVGVQDSGGEAKTTIPPATIADGVLPGHLI